MEIIRRQVYLREGLRYVAVGGPLVVVANEGAVLKDQAVADGDQVAQIAPIERRDLPSPRGCAVADPQRGPAGIVHAGPEIQDVLTNGGNTRSLPLSGQRGHRRGTGGGAVGRPYFIVARGRWRLEVKLILEDTQAVFEGVVFLVVRDGLALTAVSIKLLDNARAVRRAVHGP